MKTDQREARIRRAAAPLAIFALGAAMGFAEPHEGAEKDAEPPWPGSFSLFGSETRLAVGGFVELDVIHDTDAISTRCDFVTAAIATGGGTPAGGADGQTSYCVNATRLTLESRTPTRLGRLDTFVSVDFFGSPDTPQLQLRQAYGELSGALFGGDLRIGQAWSTYTAVEAFPDTLDYEGPDSAIGVRQPMVRWTKGVSTHFEVRVALEQPGDGSIVGADLLTRWPDAVGVVKWTRGRGFVRASGIVRDVRASANDGPVQTALGWGVAGAGMVPVPFLGSKDTLSFEASYGVGTGAYYADGPPDGAWDPVTSSLELLPLFGVYAGFEHWWSRSLSSTLLYSVLDVDNLDVEPDDAFRKSVYASVNLVWRPDPALLFGVEFLRGRRQDKDGAKGTDNRIQLTSQLSF